MSSKSILSFLLLITSWGFGQSAGNSPSKKDLINDLEAAPAKQQNTLPAQKTEAGHNPESSLGTIAASGLDPHIAPATALSNDELLIRGKTVYVISNSFFVKKEQLERGLLERAELAEWGIHVVSSPKNADLVLTVRRAPFQNNFPFTFTDRVSGIVVMGGTVNSLFGTVPGKIAGRLADKLKEIRKAQEEPKH